ncbi:MAG: TonB-dependent receptor [Candidatus Azobacteroides sp.]|nr:TonB-dependent receptor [Candidatus Azobacteroides sp.]
MRKNVILLFFLSMSCLGLFAQNQITVSGTVLDKTYGDELIGVAVQVKGTGNGALTDINGNYTISFAASSTSTLVFSYVGYKTKEVKVSSSGTVDVELEPDVLMIEEVVAIGYGTMKKSDLTGSVGSVSGEKLKALPVSGVDQALQGRLAGVTVNANSGQPGARASIRIRGIGSVNADSSPLFVVDGVMVDDIDFLSPNDIQSTEVLKDASATAIYGSRGANGVILVTTKKGNFNNKANVSYETYFGWQNRWKSLDLMNRDEFAYFRSYIENYYVPDTEIDPVLQQYFSTGDHTYFNQWLENTMIGGQVYFPRGMTASNPNGLDYASIDTNWQDEVFNSNAFMQSHYVGVDGGSDKSTYAISGNYFHQDGTLINSWYKRLTLRLNTSHKVNDWLKVGENLAYSRSSNRNAANNNINASVLSSALSMAPWDPTYYPEGSISYPGRDIYSNRYPDGRDLSGQPSASSNFKNVYNPFSDSHTSFPTDQWERWVGDIYAEVTPVKGLTLRGDVSLDLSNGENMTRKIAYMYSSYDNSEKNFYSSVMSKYRTVIYEATANYNNTIGKHSFNVLAGTTREDYDDHTISGSGIPLTNLSIEDWTLSKLYPYGEEEFGVGESFGKHRRISFIGRLHYSFDSKYLATLSFRRDGSSKFPKEELWGNFPSVALAWRISDESFYEPVAKIFDTMKIRAGWGQIGNDKLGNNQFVNTMGSSANVFYGYPFGMPQQMRTGATLLYYASPGKWETSEQWNVGIDFSTANGHFYGNIDAFIRNTKDLLLTTPNPGHVGYRMPIIANAGTMRNEGVEFSLEYRNRIGEFNFSVSGNATILKNRLTKLNEGEKIFEGNGFQLTDEGLPVKTFWGYQYEGIFQSVEQIKDYYSYITDESVMEDILKTWGVGSAIYADINKDGKIDENDKVNLGNPFPWLTYGINASFDYKGFDLQLFFQGVQGNEIVNAMRLYRTENSGLESNVSRDMANMWTPDNPNGTIPNPLISRNTDFSNRYVENGSYFRLKNIQLGYTIPQQALQKLQVIQGIRVYVAATNLFTLTKYNGYDPEVGVDGVDYGNYPQARVFTIGAKLNF